MKIHVFAFKNHFFIVRRIVVMVLVICSLWIGTSSAYASKDLQETMLPENLYSGLAYLRELVDPKHPHTFDPDRIAEVLDFVQKPQKGSKLYYSDNWFGADSAYYEFDINENLSQTLRLSHSPDIPSFLLLPSSVRLSYWKKINGRNQPLPRLWERLPNLDRPEVLKGVEYIENTPDIFSGAYYRYDLNRALILFKYQGRNIFISISKQADISDVGRKGLVLGSDDDWNYLYSDQKGLTKAGLGWISSYMYDSFSITVYDEINPGQPLVRCGIFKWVRAGWAKLNVVNKRHIYAGMDRYVKTFKEIVENPFLPEPAELERLFAAIDNFSEQELKGRVQKYFKALKEHYASGKDISRMWIDEILKNDRYVTQLTKKEMKSILVLEELKKILHKKFIAMDAGQSR